MKRIAAMLIMAVLMAAIAGLAEPSETETEGAPAGAVDETDAGFAPESEGYTGEWVSVDALNIEFCLPDGWQVADTQEDVVLYAANGDASAQLYIYLEAQDVEDLTAWAEENLNEYETGTANQHEVLIEQDAEAGQIFIQFINAENQLITFQFDYDAESGLTREFALEIVGSAHDIWG